MRHKDIEIGTRVKTERQINGLTQKELAEKLNVSQTAIALWESGSRSIPFDIIDKLGDIFQTSPVYLLFGEEAKNQKDEQSFDYTVKFKDKDYLLEMLDKAKKLENEHDKELLTFMIEALLKKAKGTDQ